MKVGAELFQLKPRLREAGLHLAFSDIRGQPGTGSDIWTSGGSSLGDFEIVSRAENAIMVRFR